MSRFTHLKKFLGFSEGWKVYQRLKKHDLQNIKIKKLAYPFTMRDNPFDYATFEEVILKEAYKIPVSFTPEHIIDGGGNIGLTAIYFANVFPQATIITLEPDKENFEVLVHNVAPYKKIKADKAGVWNKPAYLSVNDNGMGNNAFTVSEVTGDEVNAIEGKSISQIMIDNEWDHIDILKIDVEGSEKEIFSEGYDDWLPKTRIIIIELHDHMKKGCSNAVFSALNNYNFSFAIAGENVVFTNERMIV